MALPPPTPAVARPPVGHRSTPQGHTSPGHGPFLPAFSAPFRAAANTALILALILVLSLGATALAAEDQSSVLDGSTGAAGVKKNADHSSVGTTLNIPKGITVYGSMDKVYGPTVTYTYSIAPRSITNTSAGYDYTVTDFNNASAKVKAGPADGVTLSDSTAVFTSSEVTLSSGTAEITDNITVSVDLTKFANTTYGPGIYRYTITDTTAINDLYAAGITRDDNYNTTRDLDVYIKYNAAGTALEVYGYVLLDTPVSPEGVDDQPLQWVTPTTKSSGYIDAAETYTDEYHTIDLTLTKVVTGDMGNKNHQFPFAFTVSNLGLNYYHGETTANTSASYTATATTSISGIGLANGETYSIRGLNPKATINYTETNDTVDTYTLTVTNNGGASSYVKDNAGTSADIHDVEIAMLVGTKTTETMAVSNYDTDNSVTSVKATIAATDAQAVTFTNNLNAISPTGVVLRIAPYALMLVAGFVFFVLMRRRREEAEEA